MGTILGFLIIAGILLNTIFTGFTKLNIIYLILALIIAIYNLSLTKTALKFGQNKKRDRLINICVYIVTFSIIFSCARFIFPTDKIKNSSQFNKCISILEDGNSEKAETELLKLKEKDPKNPDINNALAVAYLKEGKTDLMKKYLDEAYAENKKDENILFNYGMMYYKNKDYKNALINYEKAIKLNPDMIKAYTYAGYMSYILRDLTKALYYFEYAYFLNPSSPEICIHIARSYTELSDFANAKIYYDRALALKPSAEQKKLIDDGLSVLKLSGGENK